MQEARIPDEGEAGEEEYYFVAFDVRTLKVYCVDPAEGAARETQRRMHETGRGHLITVRRVPRVNIHEFVFGGCPENLTATGARPAGGRGGAPGG